MQRGVKLDALGRLHELAMRHATHEQRERLNRLTAGVAPGGYHKPLEHGFYVAEITAILFERQFAELAELRAMVQGLAELDSAGPIPKSEGRGGGSPRRIGRPAENRGEQAASAWPS